MCNVSVGKAAKVVREKDRYLGRAEKAAARVARIEVKANKRAPHITQNRERKAPSGLRHVLSTRIVVVALRSDFCSSKFGVAGWLHDFGRCAHRHDTIRWPDVTQRKRLFLEIDA